MRFAAHDHLGQSGPLVQALVEAGHELTSDGPLDLFLMDLDPDKWGYRDLIDFYHECGAVVLQYPHGAPLSTIVYDNLYPPHENVSGQLTHGRGEVEFLRIIGVERPARIMGWQICRQFEFRDSENPRRVVFAPTHVNGDGSIEKGRAELNADVYRQLLEGDWELVVRYLGDLERLGLWKDDRVFRYVAGSFDMTTVEMDAADCVVAAAGTYPSMAIARGVPAIMYGQFDAAVYGLEGEEPRPLRNLEKYRDLVRYPYDVEDGHLDETIYEACRSDERIADWRETWLGEPFDASAFVALVEAWVPELRDSSRIPVST